MISDLMFQLTAARRRLAGNVGYLYCVIRFQLTAARRRLVSDNEYMYVLSAVSTHSRPKAAGDDVRPNQNVNTGFNSQPPEGGWHQK